MYKTDLQTILEMLKYRQDKERMQKYVQDHEGVLSIAQAAEKAGKSEEEFKQLIQM